MVSKEKAIEIIKRDAEEILRLASPDKHFLKGRKINYINSHGMNIPLYNSDIFDEIRKELKEYKRELENEMEKKLSELLEESFKKAEEKVGELDKEKNEKIRKKADELKYMVMDKIEELSTEDIRRFCVADVEEEGENVCPRCGGLGSISEYSHIYDGICFKCGGTGEVE